MRSITFIIFIALGLSLLFVFHIANYSTLEESGKSIIHMKSKSSRESFKSRISNILNSLEDGKEVLRETLYQESLNTFPKDLSPNHQHNELLAVETADTKSHISLNPIDSHQGPKLLVDKKVSIDLKVPPKTIIAQNRKKEIDLVPPHSNASPVPPTMSLPDTKKMTVNAKGERDLKKAVSPKSMPIGSKIDKPRVTLPGGAGHIILSMSDSEFRNTSISEMMSSYGEASGGGSCSMDFGNELKKRWRARKEQYCSPTSTSKSSIDCYLVHQTRHHGNGDNLCHMHNVAVDMGIFNDDLKMRPVVENYRDTTHNVQPYVKFPKGFVQSDCKPVPELWQAASMPGWNVDWTVNALETIPSGAMSKCDEWIDHNVLIVQRDTFANFFHDSEDLINAFLALAILDWRLENTQIYFTDLYPEGPFWPIWEKVFSAGGGIAAAPGAMSAWALKNRFGKQGKQGGEEYRVCFKSLAVGIYGPAAPITVASWDTPCSKTALVRAYSDFIIRGLDLQGVSHYAKREPSNIVQITYMSRRPSREWPEKKFCNDTHSFFLCQYWSGPNALGSRSLGRMVQNDAEVVRGLRSLQDEVFSNGAKVVLTEADYNELSLEQQIETDMHTDIMVGPHGAGLMHNIFMPDRGVLIELFIDGSGGNRHFHNLAHWYGRKYIGEGFMNPIPVNKLLTLVRNVVTAMDISSY